MFSDGGSLGSLYPWSRFTEALQKCPDRPSSINHTVRETPFIIIPAQDPNELAIDDLSFGQVEDGAVRVMVEIRGDQRHVVCAKDPFEVSGGSC